MLLHWFFLTAERQVKVWEMSARNRQRVPTIFFASFTLATLLSVASNLIWRGTPDFEDAFYVAIIMSIMMPVAILVFDRRRVGRRTTST